MSKYFISIALIAGCLSQSWSQELTDLDQTREKKYSFVSITELGYMFGRIKAPEYGGWFRPITGNSQPDNYKIINTKNLTINMFNGVYINPKTAVGLSLGIDAYSATLVVPIQAGIRQTLLEKREGGNKLFAALDLGFGSTFLQEDDSDYKTNGGMTFNPTVGFRIKMRNTSSFVLNLGYKYQELTVEQTLEDPYYSAYLETRNHHRMIVRFGLEF